MLQAGTGEREVDPDKLYIYIYINEKLAIF
jgi:hypothetical protein